VQKISEDEARALLAYRKVCQDCPAWVFNPCLPSTASVECGLVDENGERTQLTVELLFNTSQKTNTTTIAFSMFKLEMGERIRVYQLHVKKRRKSSEHDLPHEHIGSTRVLGLQEWNNWGYDEALQHFCMQANIEFVPPVCDPAHFELIS
jgi:hypothetical protein